MEATRFAWGHALPLILLVNTLLGNRDAFVLSLSVVPSSPSVITNGHGAINRRRIFSHFASQAVIPATLIATATSLLLSDPALAVSLDSDVATVILDSPDARIGVELYDVTIGSSKSFVAVKSAQPSGAAASSGVEEGMIVSGKDSATARDISNRIRNGPYPIVLQFYNLASKEESNGDGTPASKNASEALRRAQAEASRKEAEGPPRVTAKGTGLVIETTQKPAGPCRNKEDRAKRGDTLEIRYEARVASPGGPLYDSTHGEQRGGRPVSFVLGKGEAIKGVDIGLDNMCVGETRELDIPSALGYGMFGSEVFDIPGDVRLWWKVELVSLTKKGAIR